MHRRPFLMNSFILPLPRDPTIRVHQNKKGSWVQEENEVIYVLSGTLTVTPDGGKPATLGPGDVAVFPRG